MGKGRAPKVDAVVVCRSIATDEQRTQWNLVGVVRGRLEGETFPLELPGLGVYLAMTGMQGTYDLAVEIAELATGKVIVGTKTTTPKRVDDPLAVVSECIPLPAVVFENRGRHVCRLLVNGEPVHETAFEVDWPRPAHVQGKMSPESFARGLARLRERDGADLGHVARICGVEPEFLDRMSSTFEGLDPERAQDVIARLCHHFRTRPEEFMEDFG